MAKSTDAEYLRQRARASRRAAFTAADVCARSSHLRMAEEYDFLLRETEVVSDTIVVKAIRRMGALRFVTGSRLQ